MKAKSILIVEDDPDILELLHYILTEEGYKVIPSVNGEEVKLIGEPFPDLILMDIRLSQADVDGASLCLHLKSQDHTRNLPVVLISAETDIRHIQRNCLADGYISKPFDVEALVRIVNAFITAN